MRDPNLPDCFHPVYAGSDGGNNTNCGKTYTCPDNPAIGGNDLTIN